MRKRNGGFTLIELMIAIAVLSTMAGVLLQGFVVGARMNQKARKEEVVQNLARKTMEEMKGYSFEKLHQMVAEAGEGNTVSIAGTEYQYRELPLPEESGASGIKAGEEDGAAGPGNEESSLHSSGQLKEGTPEQPENGYRLVAEYRRDPASEKADYLIAADIDWGMFSEKHEEENSDVYSINRYEMPNIVDVDSFLNVVIDPETLVKDDQAAVDELQAKVDAIENEDEADEGEDGDDEDKTKTEAKLNFIKKTLAIYVRESDSENNKLLVKVQAVYTANFSVTEKDKNTSESSTHEETLVKDLKSFKKSLTIDDKSRKPMNRIYLFLPKNGSNKIDGIEFSWSPAINFDWDTENTYELFVIASGDTGTSGSPSKSYWNRDDIIINGKSPKEIVADKGECILYTNLAEGDMPVSLADPERRLYRLTVTVYTAIYEGESSEEPVFGEEVLKLDSTKSE